jgi:hypothetical protein
VEDAKRSGAKVLSYGLATFVVALSAMILLYNWVATLI